MNQTDVKSIEIQYFAYFREKRGLNSEVLETTAHTVSDVYEELNTRHAFDIPKEALKVAVNDEFTNWERDVRSGDSIVFIPPVAGGQIKREEVDRVLRFCYTRL